MGISNGGQGPLPPSWIFKHGTDIVDRGLIVPFSVFFGIFMFFFSVDPPSGNFSADAFDCNWGIIIFSACFFYLYKNKSLDHIKAYSRKRIL